LIEYFFGWSIKKEELLELEKSLLKFIFNTYKRVDGE